MAVAVGEEPLEDHIDLTGDDNEGEEYVSHSEEIIQINTMNANRREEYMQSSESHFILESNEDLSDSSGECPSLNCESSWMIAKDEPDLSEPPVLTVEITTEENSSIPIKSKPTVVKALPELEFIGLDEMQTSQVTAADPQISLPSGGKSCGSVYSMAGTSDTSFNSDLDSLGPCSPDTLLSYSSPSQTGDSLEDIFENCLEKTADDSPCTTKETLSARSIKNTPSLLPQGTRGPEQDPALGTQKPVLHVLCWLQRKSSNKCLLIEHKAQESELTSADSRSPILISVESAPPDLTLVESIPPDLPLTESISPDLPLIESIPPDLPLTESIPPDLPLTESISPDLPLIESISPDLPLIESISPDLPLTESISPDLPLTESISPDLSLTESISPDLPSTESIPPDLSLTESISPDLPSTESIPPDLSLTESIPPYLAFTESIPPDLPLTESIPPDLPLTESIPPDLSLTESIPPNLALTKSRPPEMTLLKSRTPALALNESTARITTTTCTYIASSTQGSVSEPFASAKASASAGSAEASPNYSIDKEMLRSFQYLIGAPIQHIFVNQHRSERGDKEPISQRQHNMINSTIDEDFAEVTLQLLTDFVSPQRYPSSKVVEHVIKKILLGCETHNIVQSAYMVLMKIQQLHPATVSTVQWDWELLAYHMENKEHHKMHLHSSFSQLLFLQYVIQTLDDDFQLRLRHNALNQSIAKAVLSCDDKFSNVRSVLKWLIDTITTESEDKDDLSARSEPQPSGSSRVDSRIPRITCLLQRMLTLAVEVDRSPTCSSNKIAEALFQHLLYISKRSHRMMLLTSMESRLLRCKLLDILFHYYTKKQSSLPMSLAKILHFLKYAKISLETEEQFSSKWQCWDEFIHLLCLLLLSYQEVTRCHLRYSITDRVKNVLAEMPPVLTTHDEITLQDIEFDMKVFHKRVTSDLKAPLNPELKQQTDLLKALLCDATGT
ncbi:SUMO-interacting motif-containing protein 1 isoform X2 [Callorhinchus milii]|uniref:SUMO-interacting motif-containing protein 1 isoform X2 n=1 Tax=Callorhinchus milii TaxID=7868 RepID=UPI001C3FD3C9|nr:SUMO-interacting motif-containing protein 1 isoform X2 [Callorhinchus milii]